MARTPIHPGEILADELEEIGISASELARLIEVPAAGSDGKFQRARLELPGLAHTADEIVGSFSTANPISAAPAA
ncbi:MAG: hypothetical protein RQ826_15750 [Xanthomonadales bacterium]|nr:hypothetical protein [Xanthomonadales bacterium]